MATPPIPPPPPYCATARVETPKTRQGSSQLKSISSVSRHWPGLLHQQCEELRFAIHYLPRLASSASSARSRNNSKNAGGWPMKSPMAVKKLTTPMAIPCVSVGRITEHGGSFRLRNGHGSGMIRLG